MNAMLAKVNVTLVSDVVRHFAVIGQKKELIGKTFKTRVFTAFFSTFNGASKCYKALKNNGYTVQLTK